jgi:hypothetical protein
VAAFPVGTWVAVTIELEEGPDRPKTYTLRLAAPGVDAKAWPGLPFQNSAFAACTWVGVAGIDAAAGVFYVDDVVIE